MEHVNFDVYPEWWANSIAAVKFCFAEKGLGGQRGGGVLAMELAVIERYTRIGE